MSGEEESRSVAASQVPGLLGVVGWLVVVSGLFHGAYIAAETREITGLLPGLGVIALGLLLVGVGEVLATLIAIERNTRELADEARRAMDEE